MHIYFSRYTENQTIIDDDFRTMRALNLLIAGLSLRAAAALVPYQRRGATVPVRLPAPVFRPFSLISLVEKRQSPRRDNRPRGRRSSRALRRSLGRTSFPPLPNIVALLDHSPP
jgi:hypothetical protein